MQYYNSTIHSRHFLDITPKYISFWGRKRSKLGDKKAQNLPKYPDKSQYKCYFCVTDHKRGSEDEKMTWFDISSKFTFIWGVQWVKDGGQNGSKRPKTGLSPDKSKSRCYFWVAGHMRGWGDVKVTLFDITPKFTLIWGV